MLKCYFDVDMGNGIDAIMTTNDNPKYNYVSRDRNGNGVVGFVDEISGEEPFPAGAMSLALGGSFLGSHDNRGKISIDETYEFSDYGYIPDWDWMDSYMKSLPYSDRI